MSLRALHLATRNHLRSTVTHNGVALAQKTCEVMGPDGKPPARSGEYFVAVHGGGAQNQSRDDLDETYHLFVTVTMRAAKVSPDKWGPDLLDKATTGLDVLCRSVKIAVHKDANNDLIIRAANVILGAGADGFSGINGFVESLLFESEGEDRPVGMEWFSAHVDGTPEQHFGFARTLRFGSARLIQTLESMV